MDPPSHEAAKLDGQQLADGLRPIWAAVDGEQTTYVEVFDESGSTVARCKVEG